MFRTRELPTRVRDRERSVQVADRPKPARVVAPHMATCAEADCEDEAAVRVYVPWAEDREVCTAHARVLVQQDGVVAEPLEGVEWR
ncbi:hypothetical protein [Salinirubrum litoreum]|uniref:DUF8014 domain-containing protein n=1 Tax=Salinirubrum litoreum TaxID=1126234 RepID=A0ABD5R8Z9_9EURY|nr:hypothetical protein [Salinirubrum litoreum]